MNILFLSTDNVNDCINNLIKSYIKIKNNDRIYNYRLYYDMVFKDLNFDDLLNFIVRNNINYIVIQLLCKESIQLINIIQDKFKDIKIITGGFLTSYMKDYIIQLIKPNKNLKLWIGPLNNNYSEFFHNDEIIYTSNKFEFNKSFQYPIIPEQASIFVSEGCYNNCTFCAHIKYFPYDFEYIKNQIEEYRKYGITNFQVISENSNYNVYKDIYNLFKKEEHKYFWVSFNTLKLVYRDHLYDENTEFCSNIENVNKDTQKIINKFYDKYEYYDICKKLNIESDFIIGFPGETIESINENLDYLYSMKDLKFTLNLYYNLYGTELSKKYNVFKKPSFDRIYTNTVGEKYNYLKEIVFNFHTIVGKMRTLKYIIQDDFIYFNDNTSYRIYL